MKNKQLIPITRFKYPNIYSNNLNQAINEFKDDIARLYTAGYTYNEVYNNAVVKATYNYLCVKFPSSTNGNKLPYLKRFINYVFTRDETYNPFGKWFRFDYAHPAMLLAFADEIARTSNRERVSLTTLASTMFVLLQYENVTSFESIKSERGHMIDKYGAIIKSDADKKIWDVLRKGNQFENRPTIHRKPQYVYDLCGVKDYRTFQIMCKILKVECAFMKKMNIVNLTSLLLVGNVSQLRMRFNKFLLVHKTDYTQIQVTTNDINSGIILPTTLENKINKLYDEVLMRDKSLPSNLTVSRNPLIRIQFQDGRMQCYLQSGFYNFRLILASLYLNQNKTRRSLKSPLSKALEVRVREEIMKAGNFDAIDWINVKLGEGNISTKLKSISTPLNHSYDAHFKQINNCYDVVKEISDTGIMIKLSAAEELLRSTISQIAPEMINSDSDSDIVFENDLEEYDHINRRLDPNDKAKELQKLIGRINPSRESNNDLFRIKGIFTSHGAATHRMTSHDLNLQGINREIREKIFAAPAGKCLLSADVAGQDIAIAANLAKKLYQSPSLFGGDYVEEFSELHEKINSTIGLLGDSKSSTSRPIDFILDNILSMSSLLANGWDRGQIRNEIKRAVYTFLYGGGKDSYLNALYPEKIIKELLVDVKDSCVHIEKAARGWFRVNSGRSLTYRWSKVKNMDEMIINIDNYFNNFQDKYFHIIKDRWYRQGVEDELAEVATLFEKVKTMLSRRIASSVIYDMMQEVIKTTYPGIIESLDYYLKYYEQNYVTYPTLLGWQTLVTLKYDYGMILTRSKSYPVQASGAEFIRQWLIELKREKPKGLEDDNAVKIVNVIHDQIIIEVDESLSDIAGEWLINKAKEAAAAVQIDPATIHIPEIKTLYTSDDD